MKDFVNTARDLFQDRQGRVSSVFTAMAALARSQAKATLDLASGYFNAGRIKYGRYLGDSLNSCNLED